MSYQYFLSGLSISSDVPSEIYANEFQAFVNDSFNVATDVYTVGQETSLGSGIYNNVSVRINHAVESETGIKLGDDFKVFIFKNNDLSVELGQKFYFDDNYWLTINTDNLKGLTSSVVVRRCNNVLRWMSESGSSLFEHCIIDYTIATPDNKNRTDPIIGEGTIKVYAQLNSKTHLIKENQRFLFGKVGAWSAYRVYGGGIMHFLNNKTSDNTSAQLLLLALGKNFVNVDTDDITNGVADYYIYNSGSPVVSSIGIEPVSGSIIESGSQVFSVYLYSGGTVLPDAFTFTVSGSSTVPTNNYTFATIDNNHFSVLNIERYLSDPLLIQCQSGSNLRIKDIYLRGIW
jgi:hypothetical protein